MNLRPYSPARKHPDADDAQYLLAGNNRHKQKTYSGKIDGYYGEATGHAADRMRYWLGYPKGKINLAGRFGDQLYSYLLPLDRGPARKLPLAYRLRRKARLAAEKRRKAKLQGTAKRKALAYAITQIGYHEAGYSNSNKFGQEFGWDRVPWCAEFVSICFKRAGRPYRTALARQFEYWANSGTYGFRRTYHPEPGDIVVFRDGGGHVEIFRRGTASYFESVGGNTSCAGGSWNNGGEVCSHWHGTERDPYFVRVP